MSWPLYWRISCALVATQLGLAVLPGTAAPELWYAGLLVITSAVLYLLPVIALAELCRRILKERGGRIVSAFVAWLGTTALQVLLVADRTIYQVFSFHLNGFAWNLATTPGGIESMGGGSDTEAGFAAMVVGWGLLQAAALLVAHGWTRQSRFHRMPELDRVRWHPRAVSLAALLAFSTLGERLWHGWASIEGNNAVLAIADRAPFYVPITFRQLAEDFGVPMRRHVRYSDEHPGEILTYPLNRLSFDPLDRRPNIVFMVCESLRADMLTPKVMPKTWAMAQKSLRFAHHYSGGNGTRVGMFTLFYGVHGTNWHRFLLAGRAPVLMQRLQQLDYQLLLQTSARFTYPEFDRTLFVGVPDALLHEDHIGPSWARDRRNVARFEHWLTGRDRSRPFLYFQFFESPHARYDFPPESVIAKPYLAEVNYAALDVRRDMPLLENRYVNAVHHVDSQIGRVLSALTREHLLDSTIVVVTGDHGEEFMEKGNWGHNSFFTEEQTRVPLVLHVPGLVPAAIERMTSHLDVAPTLLRLLGVNNPANDFSDGVDLIRGPSRDGVTFADWNHIGILMDGYKFSLPTSGPGYVRHAVTDAEDADIADPEGVTRAHELALWNVLRAANRFHARSDNAPSPN